MIIALIFTSSVVPAMASENDEIDNNINEVVYTMNEYEGILSEIEEINIKLVTNGKNVQNMKRAVELAQHRDGFISYIYDLKKLSDIELEAMNFNASQINAIKYFDGSDHMARAASATMNCSYSRTSYSYNSTTDKTYVTMQATYSWSGSPYIKSVDQAGVAMAGSIAQFAYSSASCVIAYPSTGTITQYNPTISLMAGVRFDVTSCDGNGAMFTSCVVTYSGVAQGHVTVMAIGAAYAHKTVAFILNGGLSISTSGNSISFGVTPTYSYDLMINVSKSYY